jgi:von Willebrand factor type A domain-containing protein
VTPRPSIPLSSLRALSSWSRWTLAARVGLAVLLVGGLALVFLLSHHRQREDAYLEAGKSPVIALDVSWSVTYDRSKLIERTLKSFVDAQRRVGFVLFSDTAYEALPIGTRSDALQPFLRFFAGADENPWRATFSAGTRISAALDLAHTMLHEARVENGSVVLISDLADSPNDETDLARTLVTFQRERIPIRMIGIDPNRQDEQFFREALRSGGGSVTALRTASSLGKDGTTFPVVLVVVVALFALLLALNEHVLGALTWSRRREPA